jgi:CRP/FNR family transcriptional regulator, cyclic AMP receptor protein
MSFRSLVHRIFMDPEFEEKVNFMSRIPFFQGLHKRDLGKLIGIMHAKAYPANEVVFQEGATGRALFIIESGEVAIVKSRHPSPEHAEEAILARLGPGGFFGEMALLEELPRSATAQATKDSVLHFVYKTKLDAFVEKHPGIGVKILHNLAKVLSARLRETSESYIRHL